MNVSPPDTVSYVPYHEIGDRPNIIVDGAPLKSTVLTLSHWPVNHTPEILKRDTSTAIVFAYLDSPEFYSPVDIVSNNHFDEDGLFSTFAVCRPEIALAHRDLLIGASLAGDFGIVRSRDAARLCFIIEAFTDPDLSPLDANLFADCERRQVVNFYQEMLGRLPSILDNIEAYEELWAEQDAQLELGQALIADGRVIIDETPELDLAVVHIPADLPTCTVHRYLQAEEAVIHPFAINSATQCSRIIRLQGSRFDFHYRYDSWLQLASRRPLLRVVFDGLIDKLNELEKAPGNWRADKVSDIIPRVCLEGTDESQIPAAEFVDTIKSHLQSAPVAWDPYDWKDTDTDV
jgi:hypothetical protein